MAQARTRAEDWKVVFMVCVLRFVMASMTGIHCLRLGMRLFAAGLGRTDLDLPRHDVIVAERSGAVNRDMATVPVSGSPAFDGKQDDAISASNA